MTHEDDLLGEVNVSFNAYSYMDAGCWNSIVSILTRLWDWSLMHDFQ